MFDKAIAEFGRVDGLVNNAATNVYFGPMLGIDGRPGTRSSR
jgi:NAD(P)-dependent dehydrogenase (short-subunit alcohol dehydrogenase family)